MEDKNIIYNKTNDNITPIDTSAKDFAFEISKKLLKNNF